MAELIIVSKVYGSHTILYDDCDHHLFKDKKIYLKKSSESTTMYAAVWWNENGARKIVFMHRLIMDFLDTKMDIDHRNKNGLDNRRKNLRICTHSENYGQ